MRYSQGDFISSHTDADCGRFLAVLVYLGPYGEGGELIFKSGTGFEKIVEPLQSRVVLMPIGERFCHEVAEWRSDTPGRLTLSMGFRLRGE